jgi:hypothetical protein
MITAENISETRMKISKPTYITVPFAVGGGR